MSDVMQRSAPPEVRTGMGIHRPPGEVFDAFVNPATTKRFWIFDSTGPLQLGSTVTWDMTADGAQATIEVRIFERGQRLEFAWGDQHHMNTVRSPFPRGATTAATSRSLRPAQPETPTRSLLTPQTPPAASPWRCAR